MQRHYATLGLDSSADEQTVKREYRKLVKICHPDRNPGDPNAANRFNEITLAYNAIVDKKPISVSTGTTSLLITVDLHQVYLGFTCSYGGDVFRFLPGFEDGGVYLFQTPNGKDVEIRVILSDYPGFRREGLDLHTEMTVRQRDIDTQKLIRVGNHPNFLYTPSVVFPKHATTGRSFISEKNGLPDNKGKRGDLYVTAIVVPTPWALQWFYDYVLDRFAWWVFAICLVFAYLNGGW